MPAPLGMSSPSSFPAVCSAYSLVNSASGGQSTSHYALQGLEEAMTHPCSLMPHSMLPVTLPPSPYTSTASLPAPAALPSQRTLRAASLSPPSPPSLGWLWRYPGFLGWRQPSLFQFVLWLWPPHSGACGFLAHLPGVTSASQGSPQL